MNRSLALLTLTAAFGLVACNPPAVVAVPTLPFERMAMESTWKRLPATAGTTAVAPAFTCAVVTFVR